MNTTNPYAPPQAAVQDEISAPGTLVLAGRITRLVTAILDGLIFAVMVYAPFVLSAMATGHPLFTNARFNTTAALNPAVGLLPLAGLITFTWLSILFVSRNGQSIGKKIVGIRVVRTDGTPASLARIFWVRNVIPFAIGAIPLLGSVFWIVDALMIFGSRRQCLHDKIADTIVINA
jgi:uncharacterized RDD family membrane protein YckC